MTKETTRRCDCCNEITPADKLQRVGLIWLCPSCIDERDSIQSIETISYDPFGRCGGDL